MVIECHKIKDSWKGVNWAGLLYTHPGGHLPPYDRCIPGTVKLIGLYIYIMDVCDKA